MDHEFLVGPWLVRPPLCRINRGEESIRIRPKVMDILVFLARHPGEVISKDRLLNEIWGTDAVSESALTRSITELRQAFGDPVEQPAILETIPKRGYRLIATVAPVEPETIVAKPTRPPFARSTAIAATAILVVTAACAFIVTRRSEPPRVGGRTLLLITAFENRTGDPRLDGTLEYALERELVASPFVNIEPRDSIDEMLGLMRKPIDTRIDAAIGREIASRDATIDALVTGRIEKIGSRYALTLGVVNPSSGRLLAGTTDDAPSASELLRTLGRQALAIRRSLGESRESVDANRVQLDKVTTPSLEALKAYSMASATFARTLNAAPSDLDALAASAEQDLRRALELDPSFASAHMLLAWVIYGRQVWRGHRSDAAEYLGAAEAASRLSASDAEHLFILASLHHLRAEATARWPYAPSGSEPASVKDELSQAMDAYERYLELRPGDSRALRSVGMICERLGRRADLARILGRAAAARPNSFDANVTAAEAYIRTGDLAAAGAVLDRAHAALAGATAGQDSPRAGRLQISVLRAKVAWLRRDAVAAARELDRIESADSDQYAAVQTRDWRVAAAQIAFADVALGRIRRAEQIAAAIPDPPARTAVLATAFVAARRTADLRQLLRESASEHNLLGRGGSFLVNAGLIGEAKRFADDLQRSPSIVPAYVLLVRERIAATEGRTAESLAFGEQSLSLQQTRYTNQTLTIAGDMANAYLELGRQDEAVRILQDETAQPAESVGRDWSGGFPWTAARSQLAGIYARVGRMDDAAAVDNELLRLFAAADVDYPILVEVKKRIAARR